jgi:hypothetical protein
MNRKSLVIALALGFVIILGSGRAYAGPPPSGEPSAARLASGLGVTLGSTVGPDGALYVPDGAAGTIWRVDPQTGDVTEFASGLPQAIFPIGGPVDVAFIGNTAYALVSMVADDFVGGSSIVGIYQLDNSAGHTVIANLGQWAMAHPSQSDVFIETGVYYAIEVFRGGFLVTDGHHNRVLWVTRDGEISELIAFDDTVPTGLAARGETVYVAEAGEVPHLPEDGKVVSFGPKSDTATEVASGARLLVDVEFGRGRTLYALSQGEWDGVMEGSPAIPNDGALVEVNGDGTFTTVIDGLDRPTSLEFIGNSAYVITLTGEVWEIDNVSDPPYGVSR